GFAREAGCCAGPGLCGGENSARGECSGGSGGTGGGDNRRSFSGPGAGDAASFAGENRLFAVHSGGAAETTGVLGGGNSGGGRGRRQGLRAARRALRGSRCHYI